jgi:hypothetical protein
MRILTLVASLALCAPLTAVLAQDPAPTASSAESHYTTSDTNIGTLMDDPAAHAVVDKHLPGMLDGPQIGMARSMTLKAIQPYASDKITDQALADIDAELAKLPTSK